MARLRPRRSAEDPGFTLIELLIVIVILGILAGIAIFAVGAFKTDAAGAAYGHDRRVLETSIAGYYARHEAYPPNLSALVSDGFLENVTLSDSTHLVGNGYTIEFTPGSPPTLSDRDTSLAAGGTPVTPTAAASASPSPAASASPSPSASPTAGPVATTMGGAVSVGTNTTAGSSGNATWGVTMTVSITDNLGNPVNGATVSATWSYVVSSGQAPGQGTTSCSTGSSGTCPLSVSGLSQNKVSRATATVTASKSGLTWAPGGTVSGSANFP